MLGTYKDLARANGHFYEVLNELVSTFQAADEAGSLKLDVDKFPLAFRENDNPVIVPAPVKALRRVWEKITSWNENVAIIWPPLAAEVTDIVRATICFDDPYEMSCFFAYMKQELDVVKSINWFAKEEQSSFPVVPRIHCNVALPVDGRRCVFEVQLHLKAIYVYARLNHIFYEVIRATYSNEVVGAIHWPTSKEEKVAEVHMLRALTAFSSLTSQSHEESSSKLRGWYRKGVAAEARINERIRAKLKSLAAFRSPRRQMNLKRWSDCGI